MAVDMFMKIDDIKGEASDEKHKESIGLLSWSWGMSQSGTTHDSQGSGAGKVNVQDLSFTHYVDSSTPNLIEHCCTGQHLGQALLTIRKAGGSPLEYLKIKMQDVLISNVTTGGSGGEDRLTATVTLNFGKFTVEYVPQTPSGGPGPTLTKTWNIPANSKSLG